MQYTYISCFEIYYYSYLLTYYTNPLPLDPVWADVNFGIFICIDCSGIHRGLGTHISKVKSLQLDQWTEENVQKMSEFGNIRCNAIWEAKVPSCWKRPNPFDSL